MPEVNKVKNKKTVMTLCMICRGDQMLLGLKKRGFGSGKLVGFGGKVEAGENILQTATREVFEEAGIKILDAQEVGVLHFFWNHKPDVLHQVHVFKATNFLGTPTESEEMKPEWFEIKNLPYERMWADDMYWLPLFLEGKTFTGEFVLDANDAIVSHHLR